MKVSIFAFILVFTGQAFAQSTSSEEPNEPTYKLYDVTGKKCDGVEVAIDQDERFFVDNGGSIFGWRQKDSNGCRFMNFYQTFNQNMSYVEGNGVKVFEKMTLLYPQLIDKRVACPEGVEEAVLKGEPTQFSKAEINVNSITLSETENCKVLELTTKLAE